MDINPNADLWTLAINVLQQDISELCDKTDVALRAVARAAQFSINEPTTISTARRIALHTLFERLESAHEDLVRARALGHVLYDVNYKECGDLDPERALERMIHPMYVKWPTIHEQAKEHTTAIYDTTEHELISKGARQLYDIAVQTFNEQTQGPGDEMIVGDIYASIARKFFGLDREPTREERDAAKHHVLYLAYGGNDISEQPNE